MVSTLKRKMDDFFKMPYANFEKRSSLYRVFLFDDFLLLPVCVILKISSCNFLQIVEEEC